MHLGGVEVGVVLVDIVVVLAVPHRKVLLLGLLLLAS